MSLRWKRPVANKLQRHLCTVPSFTGCGSDPSSVANSTRRAERVAGVKGVVNCMTEVNAVSVNAFGVTAVAARVEGAMAVSVFEAKPERIIERGVFRYVFGLDQKRHGGDFLQRMTREVIGIVDPHEAGIGLSA